MAVAREWRGRGVGSALLAAAIERARADGVHKLSLEVFPHNEAGIALYRKFGFVEEGRRVTSTLTCRLGEWCGELSWDAPSSMRRCVPACFDERHSAKPLSARRRSPASRARSRPP